MGRTRALAGTALAVLALFAGGSKARAQCTAATETEKVRLTLEVNRKISDLETIKHQIEVEHHVIILYPGGAGMVTSEQAGELFGAAVFEGGLNPDSIGARIAEIRYATNLYLRDYILPDLQGQRECWEQLNGMAPAPPPAPTTPSAAAASAIEWPVPMDWIKVKGVARGSYVAECAGYRDYPAFRSAGTWRLELIGDGKVRGIFVDGAIEYSGVGSINASGSASGLSRSSNVELPLLGWTAQFERSGADLLMSSHTLDLRSAERGPFSILVECKPGYMRQE
jgi:hypothetical protein